MSEKVCKNLKWIVIDNNHYTVFKKEDKFVYEKKRGVFKEVNTKRHVIHYGFKIDTFLKRSMDSFCFNIHKDQDFVIVITGKGNVRVGKSTLAMQLAYYLSKKLGSKFGLSNICYTSQALMDVSEKRKKSVFIYDEARESMGTLSAMAHTQKRLLQFFAECGQLNNIYILVLPCYFELTKKMAINRCDILIDCHFVRRNTKDSEGIDVTERVRGNYRIFNEKEKRMLYLKGKDDLNYEAWRPKSVGSFNNIYPITEWKYRKKKRFALKETKKIEVKKESVRSIEKNIILKRLIKYKARQDNVLEKDICKEFGVNYGTYKHWGGIEVPSGIDDSIPV